MAASAREIPGYYYDPAKGKYFKIEKNHVAIPSSRYSQQNVRGIQEASRKRKRASEARKTQQAQKIRRSSALQDALTAGTALDRELGAIPGSSVLRRRTEGFIQHLQPRLCVDLERRRALGLYKPQVSCFDHDAATGGLLIGVTDRLIQGTVMSLTPLTDADNQSSPVLNSLSRRHQDVRAIMAVKSDISSVNIAPSRSVVITSHGNSTPPIVHLTRLLDPAEAGNEFMPVDSGMSMQFRHPDVSTIWSSAPNPYDASGNDQIAIGTQSSVIAIHGSGHWQSHPAMRTNSDVLALDWLGPHTLAAGLRNTEVRLWDSRSNGSAVRLRHKAAVTGLKSAGNETQIVVDGLRGSLSMYDLRMVRSPRKSRRPSEALLEFASDYHQEMICTGFDVHAQLGVVIAAADRDWLAAYSLRSGRRVKRWKIPHESADHESSPAAEGTIKCARFVENQRGSPNILASHNSRIMEFVW